MFISLFKDHIAFKIQRRPKKNRKYRKKKTTIPDKIFGTKWRNPVKLDRRRKVWYLFLRVF